MWGWLEVGKETVQEAVSDNITGESAKVAYYAFLSLFPLILVIFALTGLFGGHAAFGTIMGWLRRALPGSASSALSGVVAQVTNESRPGILSLGVLLTLWSASGILAALADGLNTMYDVRESRSWWEKRGITLLLLVVEAALAVAAAALMLAGPQIGRAIGIGVVWDIVVWPVAFVLLVAFIWLVYFFLPDRGQSQAKGLVLVGSVVGAILWVAATVGFHLYVTNFGRYARTYGFVGGIIVLLLWLYLSSLAILVGGELTAVLEQRRGGTVGGARASRPSRPARVSRS